MSGSGGQHDPMQSFLRAMVQVDERSFLTALEEIHLHRQSVSFFTASEFDDGNGLAAAKIRPPPAHQIEVGPIRNQARQHVSIPVIKGSRGK